MAARPPHAVLAVLGAVALAGGSMLLAVPAHAETISADGCGWVDYRVVVGTTVEYTENENCLLQGFNPDVYGSPTMTFTPGGNAQLVWHQAVEQADAGCEAGWGASWQQWARGGTGGPVCVRDVAWGVGPRIYAKASVTINTNSDDAWLMTGSRTGPLTIGCLAAYELDDRYTLDDQCSLG